MDTRNHCILNALYHSDDLTEVWHGEDTPLIACGFHIVSTDVNELARLKREGQPVWALWHGGSGYAEPYLADHLETFESHEAALGALRDREHLGHRTLLHVAYANGTSDDVYFPCVDGSRMDVFFTDPTGDLAPIPDERWSLDEDGDPVLGTGE